MNLFSVWPNNCWRELYPSVIYRFVPSWGRRQTAIHTKVPAALSLLATPTWAHLCTQLPLVPCNQSSIYSSFPAWLCLPDWSLPCEIFWHSPTWLTVTGLCCPWFSCGWSPLSVPGWDFSLRPPGPWRLIAWLLFLPSTSCLSVLLLFWYRTPTCLDQTVCQDEWNHQLLNYLQSLSAVVKYTSCSLIKLKT